MIIGAMATIKDREQFLESQVQTLAPQVDKLFVVLNGYETVPVSIQKFSNVIAICDPANTFRDVAKLYFTKYFPDDYYVTFDDDLYYPADYVSTLKQNLDALYKRCIVCLHGTILKPHWKVYYTDRSILHYHQELIEKKILDFAGTATIMFHTSVFKVPFNEIFNKKIGSDLWVAYFAGRQNLSFVSIPRAANWVRCNSAAQKGAMFVQVCRDKEWQWERNRFIAGWRKDWLNG